MVVEEGEGLREGHVRGVKEGVDAQLDVAAFDDVECHGLASIRHVQVVKASVQYTAAAAVAARGEDDRAIERRAGGNVAGGGWALLDPDGGGVVERQSPHDLVEGPVRAVLSVRA